METTWPLCICGHPIDRHVGGAKFAGISDGEYSTCCKECECFAYEKVPPDEKRCLCVGSEFYCSHEGRCVEEVQGCGGSDTHCSDCYLNALAESRT